MLQAEALTERLKSSSFVLTARSGANLIGIIEIRDYDHVALLFVRPLFQTQGVEKTLLRQAVDICSKSHKDLEKITVNSSPNAVAAYEKMGFAATDAEREVNGIRFRPMKLRL